MERQRESDLLMTREIIYVTKYSWMCIYTYMRLVGGDLKNAFFQ